MIVPCFVDTNVLVYLASASPRDASKRARAIEITTGTAFATSGQVLAEFYTVVTRKGAPPMPPALALEWIEAFEINPCVPVGPAIVKRGAELSERYQISYWDAAIIAAAEASGATTLYSEDLSHGQSYGSLVVQNPFLGL